MEFSFNIRYYKITATLIFIVMLSFCKKQDVFTDPQPPEGYKPPVVNAGKDTTILLPDGRFFYLLAKTSGSYHPMSLRWKQLSGPSSLLIDSVTQSPTLKIDVTGTYVFELTGIDIYRTVVKDTMTLTANWNPACSADRSIVNAQYSLVSESPFDIPFGAKILLSGDKLLFVGVNSSFALDPLSVSNELIIYYTSSGKWEKHLLPTKYSEGLSIVSLGNLLFIAGEKEGGLPISSVLIYNLDNGSFTETELVNPRNRMNAATIGSKVFFAGGNTDITGLSASDVVDIYDTATKTWSITKLSEARMGISSVVSGEKLYFIGGYSDCKTMSDDEYSCQDTKTIDIYDYSSGQLTKTTLSEKRTGVLAASTSTELFVTGSGSTSMEIINSGSNTTTFDCLSSGSFGNTVVINEQILYASSNYAINKYDINQKKWTLGFVPFSNMYLFSTKNDLLGVFTNYTSGPDITGRYKIYKISF